MSPRRRVRDKWSSKEWYRVLAPSYFGNVELGTVPASDPEKLIGRIINSTLYEVTDDFSHQYLKMRFQITEVDGKTAHTVFKGHSYSRDYLRSLVRRRTTKVDGIYNVTTKDEYKFQVAVCAFTLSRIRTGQEKGIRAIMRRIVNEKSSTLTSDQLAQELVLGKIASDIYNEGKKIAPLRHVGARKSKLLTPLSEILELQKQTQTQTQNQTQTQEA